MSSPEGEGRARGALEKSWDAYYLANKSINKPLLAAFPELKTILRGWVNSTMLDLFGFWMVWHLVGGFEGLQKNLGMSRSSSYLRVSQFRAAFGEHPDVFQFPGVTIDVEGFLRDMAEKKADS